MSVKFPGWIYVAVIGFAVGVATTARADGLLDRIMQVLGISATPSQMKGDGDVTAGQVWIVDLESGGRTALTTESGYFWPVYEPGRQAVVALKGDGLVRIPLTKGEGKALQKIPGVEKLVGFDRDDPDQLLVVLDKDATPLAFLSLNTGQLRPLPYDLKSKEHRRMLSHVKGEERVYGTVRVYVETLSKRTMEGVVEWRDVFLRQGEATPRNVSNCDGVTCGQPSLSMDGRAVVFIRAGE